MFFLARSTPVWPALCALMISVGFVFFAPGNIQKDASEYDRLARSMVAGQGFSLAGQPSMVREPGYPLLRAAIYKLGGEAKAILMLQAVLAALTIYLVGASFQLMHPVYGKYAGWLSLLSYSFFSFSGMHLAEIAVGCASSLLLFCWIRSRKDPGVRWILPFLAGALCLTRFTFLYLALIALIGCFFIESTQQYKRRITETGVALLLFAACLLPWMWRNHNLFGTWALTNRVGIQVYARAWKAAQPWQQLVGSYASVLTGRVAATKMGFTPIIEEQWVATVKRFALAAASTDPAQADQGLKKEGIMQLQSSPQVFLTYLAWSPLEMLRLFALTSPRAWSFSIEGMFYPQFQAQSYTMLHGLIAGVAQGLQLVWWGGIAGVIVIGFRREGLRWVPGWLILTTALTYMPFDAIVRYAVPTHPWIWGAIGYVAAQVVQEGQWATKWRKKTKELTLSHKTSV